MNKFYRNSISVLKNEKENADLKIKSLNWFYWVLYPLITMEQIYNRCNWIFICCEEWNKCDFLEKKFKKDRNSPEDWYILKRDVFNKHIT